MAAVHIFQDRASMLSFMKIARCLMSSKSSELMSHKNLFSLLYRWKWGFLLLLKLKSTVLLRSCAGHSRRKCISSSVTFRSQLVQSLSLGGMYAFLPLYRSVSIFNLWALVRNCAMRLRSLKSVRFVYISGLNDNLKVLYVLSLLLPFELDLEYWLFTRRLQYVEKSDCSLVLTFKIVT